MEGSVRASGQSDSVGLCSDSLSAVSYILTSDICSAPLPPSVNLLRHMAHSLARHIDMSASAVADIRYTYGAAFIGLLVSTVCVFSFPSSNPTLIISPTYSLYGVTVTQM